MPSTAHFHTSASPLAHGASRGTAPGRLNDAGRTTVTIVVPTRNEETNIRPLLAELNDAIPDTWACTVLFVDDSTDSTPQVIADADRGHLDVALLHRGPEARVGGLGGAVLAGFGASVSEVVVVMDADLQHPPGLVPDLVGCIDAGADLAIASRFVAGGDSAGLANSWRHAASLGSRSAARRAVPRARWVSDPLSGFFALRRAVVAEGPRFSEGFKILLDVLAEGAWTTLREVPCALQPRAGGTSKAALREGLAFGRQLWRLTPHVPGRRRSGSTGVALEPRAVAG